MGALLTGALSAEAVDTTAPTRIIGVSAALGSNNKPVIIFNSPCDPYVSAPLGLASYTVKRNSTSLSPVSFSGPGLSPQYTSVDVGTLSPTGSSSQSGADWLDSAEGAIQSTVDAFRFSYAPVSGFFSATVKIESFAHVVNANAAAGIMARDGAAQNAAYVMAQMLANGNVRISYRTAAGQARVTVGSGTVTYPAWLKINRGGSAHDLWTVWSSTDGNKFTMVAQVTVSLPLTLNVGRATTSTSDGNPVTVQYRNLCIQNFGQIAYTDTAANSGTTPSYTLTASDGVNTSAPSAPVSIAIPGTPPKKWHPGHYLKAQGNHAATDQASYQSGVLATYNKLGESVYLKGIYATVAWGVVNTTGSTFDFSEIDNFLNALPSRAKLILCIAYKSWGTATVGRLVPADLSSDVTPRSNGQGYIANVWEATVMDRLIATYEAVAARYDNDARLEMVVTDESAPTLNAGTNGYQPHDLALQLYRLYDSMGRRFKKTNAMATVNFLAREAAGLEEEAYEKGLGRASPDAIDDAGALIFQGQQVSGQGTTIRDYRTLVPHETIASAPALGERDYNGPPSHIIDWAQAIKVTHLSWVTSMQVAGNTWADIKKAIAADPNLYSMCPVAYTQGCDTTP